MILIAEAAGFSSEALRRLRLEADVVAADLDRKELLAQIGRAEVLWVRLRHRIDQEVFDAAPLLKVIVTNTTGLTHIDLDAADRRNVQVVSLRGDTQFLRTIRGTAELTLALALALVRHLPGAIAHVRSGGWDRYQFKGHDLFGKTAGIVGYGRLGQIVAGYFSAMGMRVIATDVPGVDPHLADDVTQTTLLELLQAADLVSVHVDLNPGSRRLFGADQFAAMKSGAVFINTSRGEVVDERALLAALESGKLSGAALDVVADEPPPLDRPLLRYAAAHDNLLITPHIGGYTTESLSRTEEHLAGRLIAVLRGQALKA